MTHGPAHGGIKRFQIVTILVKNQQLRWNLPAGISPVKHEVRIISQCSPIKLWTKRIREDAWQIAGEGECPHEPRAGEL